MQSVETGSSKMSQKEIQQYIQMKMTSGDEYFLEAMFDVLVDIIKSRERVEVMSLQDICEFLEAKQEDTFKFDGGENKLTIMERILERSYQMKEAVKLDNLLSLQKQEFPELGLFLSVNLVEFKDFTLADESENKGKELSLVISFLEIRHETEAFKAKSKMKILKVRQA